MEIRNDPDANITLQPGAAEAEWYEIELAKYEFSRRPIQVPQFAARRVRRISDGICVVRALYPESRTAP
jgi:hypothetical protein